MLNYQVVDDGRIVVLEPSAALTTDDFAALTRDVDALLEESDALCGLLIHAVKFPGWDSFAAFVSHLRFVKNHHHNIKRVAAVSDSKLLTLMPRLAEHFVSAEVKHFDYAQFDQARAWLEAADPAG